MPLVRGREKAAAYANSSAYQIARVYALRNDPAAIFEWLILRYKDDPRFAAFCRKAGLPVLRS